MKIYEYKDYDEYVEIQTDANKRKLKRNHSFVSKATITTIKQLHGHASNILCHGTRGGKEQKYFTLCYPDAYVIGSEISDNATDYLNTIQHDFHIVKEEWLNKFDIIYSHSWDHSYDPDLSLSTWRDQLNEHGSIYLEHAYSKANNKSSAMDPLEISHDEILEVIERNNMQMISSHKTLGGGDRLKPCKLYVIRKD